MKLDPRTGVPSEARGIERGIYLHVVDHGGQVLLPALVGGEQIGLTDEKYTFLRECEEDKQECGDE